MRRRRWPIRDSDPRVPRPPVLNIPLHTTVVEPIRDDDAADVLHALVAHLPFDAQPHPRAMLDQIAAFLEQAVARAASRGRDPQPQVIDNVAPDEPRRKILYSRPDVRTEVSAGDAGEKVDRSWQYEAPGGQEVQTPPPAVLIEDVEGPAGADRRRGSLEERRRLLPASMTMIPADRQLDEAGVRSLPASP
jgi:hypothetical protein